MMTYSAPFLGKGNCNFWCNETPWLKDCYTCIHLLNRNFRLFIVCILSCFFRPICSNDLTVGLESNRKGSQFHIYSNDLTVGLESNRKGSQFHIYSNDLTVGLESNRKGSQFHIYSNDLTVGLESNRKGSQFHIYSNDLNFYFTKYFNFT